MRCSAVVADQPSRAVDARATTRSMPPVSVMRSGRGAGVQRRDGVEHFGAGCRIRRIGVGDVVEAGRPLERLAAARLRRHLPTTAYGPFETRLLPWRKRRRRCSGRTSCAGNSPRGCSPPVGGTGTRARCRSRPRRRPGCRAEARPSRLARWRRRPAPSLAASRIPPGRRRPRATAAGGPRRRRTGCGWRSRCARAASRSGTSTQSSIRAKLASVSAFVAYGARCQPCIAASTDSIARLAPLTTRTLTVPAPLPRATPSSRQVRARHRRSRAGTPAARSPRRGGAAPARPAGG